MTQRRTFARSSRCAHDSPNCPAWAARQELEQARCRDRAPVLALYDEDPCPHAMGQVFALRRRGLELPPGITTDLWASSIASWMVGHAVRCAGPVMAA